MDAEKPRQWLSSLWGKDWLSFSAASASVMDCPAYEPMPVTSQNPLWTLFLSSSQDTREYPKIAQETRPTKYSSGGKRKTPVQVCEWAEEWKRSPLFHHFDNFQGSHVDDRWERESFR